MHDQSRKIEREGPRERERRRTILILVKLEEEFATGIGNCGEMKV